MIRDLLLAIIIGLLAFELIEHVVFPLVWLAIRGRRRSGSGDSGMLGKEVRVREWDKSKGYVSFKGELWKAESDDPLQTGDWAVIHKVEGLTLTVRSPANRVHEQ